MPAEIDTCWPTTVPEPISIHASPKIAPGGNASTEPGPNAANLRPAGLSPVTAPAARARRQAQCTARWVRPRHGLPGNPSLRQLEDAASWPQAPSISRPRVSRTVTGTPWASSRATNSS